MVISRRDCGIATPMLIPPIVAAACGYFLGSSEHHRDAVAFISGVIGTLVGRGDSSFFHIWLYLRVYAYLGSKAIRGEPRAAHFEQAECHTGSPATAENFRARSRWGLR